MALCFAAAPDVAESGILLAGSDGAGVWRSRDWGESWAPCHVGLSESAILCLSWAPPAPPDQVAGLGHGLCRHRAGRLPVAQWRSGLEGEHWGSTV